MRLSTIDVGSNTVRLLVADVLDGATWRGVDQDQKITRLGEGLARSGALGEAPMARTLAVVRGYVERGVRLRGRDIRLVAARCRPQGVKRRALRAAPQA